MSVLTQFALRLSFGLALAMCFTSPKKVASGFFRNHAYVLLGLNVFATLAAPPDPFSFFFPLIGALLSFFASAAWLYEKHRLGTLLLAAVAVASLLGAGIEPEYVLAVRIKSGTLVLGRLDLLTSGLVLGFTIAAMFLGHWYLNSPKMELAPLKRLVKLMAIAVVARGVLCGLGLALQLRSAGLDTSQASFLALRWLAGIAGVAALAAMAWQTLKIPNTQSATGILYVAVIAAFVGELTSQLLSAGTAYPL